MKSDEKTIVKNMSFEIYRTILEETEFFNPETQEIQWIEEDTNNIMIIWEEKSWSALLGHLVDSKKRFDFRVTDHSSLIRNFWRIDEGQWRELDRSRQGTG